MRLPIEHYGAGQVVKNKQDTVAMILSGSIRLFRVALDGREVNTCRLVAGDAYPLADNLVLAEESTSIQWVPVSRLSESILADPEASGRATESLINTLRQLETTIDDLAFRDSTQRTAALLLRLCEQEGATGAGECRINKHLTHRELAEQAGMSRETLSRSLAVLRRTGIVELDRRRVFIKDSDALKKLAA